MHQEVYLVGQRTAMNSGWEIGDVQLDAQLYADALLTNACPPSGRASPSVVYVIDRKYSAFRAISGIPDYTSTNGHVTFIVLGDGQQLYRNATTVGRPLQIDVDVTGVLRLELSIILSGGHVDGSCDGGIAAWVEARVE
jgi:hypothetical protein